MKTSSRRGSRFVAIFCVLALAGFARNLSAQAPVSGSAPAPSPSLITVKTYGTGGGKQIIFIPGLATPGSIWDDTVAQFKAGNQCYVVTVAGFGGEPPVKTEHFLDDVAAQIVAWCHGMEIHDPVIVGHSLGGVLALKIAILDPQLPGRLVIVDSLPFLAALMSPGVETSDDAKGLAAAYGGSLSHMTPEQFGSGQKLFIAGMVTSPDKAAAIALLTGRSDPATTGQAMSELILTDLRQAIAGIRCPVLVLVAIADKVAMGVPQAAVEKIYRDQYAKLPQTRFQVFEKARHFIMVDDPDGFDAALRGELSTK